MKKLFTLATIIVAMVLSSCEFDDSEIWDKLKEHEKRIATLEELCKQMNTNITSLQTLVHAHEKRDYITNVSVIRKDGEEVGYTISFAQSNTITIYHGQDGVNGKDGKDGKDGYTPKIGIKKDTDGVYYWTIDGAWLLDGDGNKVKAVGADGKNGQDGANGVTPRLKIENDYWYVSYDEGVTWIEVGMATGEDGSNGIDGVDGDNIFTSVIQDDEYVYFNLVDGTMITLPKHDKENIQFEDLQVKAICCKNWDTNNDGELSYAEAAAVKSIGTAFKDNTNIIAFTELKYFTGLIDIESSAFYGCSSLWKIVLPENICTIGSFAFNGCSSLKNINFPDGINSIGLSAFKNCKSLTNIIIPSNTTTIGSSAFSGCSGLITMHIPNSVTQIGEDAFEDCTGELYLDCNTPDGSEDAPSYYVYIGLFTGSQFSKVIFGDNVTHIGNYAFSLCSSIKTIVFGKNITNIGKYAFLYKGDIESREALYVKAITPPAMSNGALDHVKVVNSATATVTIPTNLVIYVPRNAVNDYKSQWSRYSSIIVGYDFEE